MEKRYQVFVSSTFRDLAEERQAIENAILEMNHIPAGMELFPAANETPWELIERAIRNSDYYVVVVGGRYGSTTDAGISYTEKEYDFARENEIPVIPLLHNDPHSLPVHKYDIDPKLQELLAAFRQKIEHNHHAKYWSNTEELAQAVMVGILRAIQSQPAPGWVRGNAIAREEALQQLVALQGERAELMDENARLTRLLSECEGTATDPKQAVKQMSQLELQYFFDLCCLRNLGHVTLSMIEGGSTTRNGALHLDAAEKFVEQKWMRNTLQDAIVPTSFGWQIVTMLRKLALLNLLSARQPDEVERADLTSLLDIDQGDLNQLIKHLVQSGLTITSDEHICITQAGKQVLAEADHVPLLGN